MKAAEKYLETSLTTYDYILTTNNSGELAQLARASALHAEGQGFDSLILHKMSTKYKVLSTKKTKTFFKY